MDASDLIRALPNSLRGAGRPHMAEERVPADQGPGAEGESRSSFWRRSAYPLGSSRRLYPFGYLLRFSSFGAENLGALMRSSVVCREVGIYLKPLHNLTAFYPPELKNMISRPLSPIIRNKSLAQISPLRRRLWLTQHMKPDDKRDMRPAMLRVTSTAIKRATTKAHNRISCPI